MAARLQQKLPNRRCFHADLCFCSTSSPTFSEIQTLQSRMFIQYTAINAVVLNALRRSDLSWTWTLAHLPACLTTLLDLDSVLRLLYALNFCVLMLWSLRMAPPSCTRRSSRFLPFCFSSSTASSLLCVLFCERRCRAPQHKACLPATLR